jgi:hypothetical protein
MGWFSNTKQKEEDKKEEAHKALLSLCPVCGENTFEKGTTFLCNGEETKVGDLRIVSEKEGDCSNRTGNETGFCHTCGGIVHGWIFDRPENVPGGAYHIKWLNRYFVGVQIEGQKASKANFGAAMGVKKGFQTIKESDMDKNMKFITCFYILVMMKENSLIDFGGKKDEAYNMLKMSRSIWTPAMGQQNSPHEKMKELLPKILPDFF